MVEFININCKELPNKLTNYTHFKIGIPIQDISIIKETREGLSITTKDGNKFLTDESITNLINRINESIYFPK